MAKKNSKTSPGNSFPAFCDFSCRHADFGDPSAVGACRRDLGVWCRYFKRYNNKNNKCIAAVK